MSWADSFLIVLTLLSAINVWALISVRRRVSRTEVHVAILRDHLKRAEIHMVSPNHRLPKSLDFLR
jgi:hypothetical protein